MSMFFSYFELASALFVLLMGFYLFSRHYENKSARFFGRMAFVAFLAALFEYSTRIAFTLEIAREVNRICSVSWVFAFSMFAHFAMIFSKRDHWLENKFNFGIFYASSFILSCVFLFTNIMYNFYEITPIGIINHPTVWFSLFGLHTIFYIALGIFFLLDYAKKTPQKSTRNQAFIMVIGTIIPASISIVLDEVFPVIFGQRIVWPTANFGIAIMMFFVFYAMRRYSLFAISPELAADVVIETMPDSLIITDLDGRIILLNEEARKLFHTPKEQILGKDFCDLFEEQAKYDKLYCEVVDKNIEIERFEALLCDPLGECIPSLINANKIRDALGATLGVVYIIRDIRG